MIGVLACADSKCSDTMEPVLRNISIDIKPGQKVGVCGRSGR
jgi:ABC-type multidrug transport system fused ATPase/permease subunit